MDGKRSGNEEGFFFFCLLVPGDVSISRETRTECGEVEEAMNERSKKANKKKEKRKMEREREREREENITPQCGYK